MHVANVLMEGRGGGEGRGGEGRDIRKMYTRILIDHYTDPSVRGLPSSCKINSPKTKFNTW